MADPYYLTTAISYPNGPPHIGHAYEAISADVIARYQRLTGREVRFQTGTDEHGLKMAQKARELGKTPRELSDEMSTLFHSMCDKLNVSYDRFIRTVEPEHHRASQALWQAMEANGDLYLDRYEGWYSVRDEAYYDESELVGGEGEEKLSPQGTPVEWTVEESWFFRLSKYQEPLLALYREHPEFIQPDSRRNEVMRFVEGGLRDLSVSRTSFDWGVKVPGHEDHVMYVWVDALTNYLTGLGYPDETPDMAKFWPADLHLIGKDIVRFHAIYWPAFLMSAGLPVPKQVFGHGFLLNRGQKESKSLGNVTDPLELAESVGVDALRFYLMDLATFGSDGNYSNFDLVAQNNAILAGTFGNLLQRVVAFVSRKLNGRAPAFSDSEKIDDDLRVAVGKEFAHWMAALHNLEISRASGACTFAASACNKYVDDVKPWSELKSNPARAEHTLATLIVTQVRLWLMLSPFIPESAEMAFDILNVPKNLRGRLDWDITDWYLTNFKDMRFESPTPIFQTFELA